MHKRWLAAIIVAGLWCGTAAAIDLGAYVRADKFGDVMLSPGGDYLAATVPADGFTAVIILRTDDNTPVGNLRPPLNSHVFGLHWVNNDQVMFGLAQKFGTRDAPWATGELLTLDARTGRPELLVGYRDLGLRVRPKYRTSAAAFLSDALPGDDAHVVIAVGGSRLDANGYAAQLEMASGKQRLLARAPMPGASYVVDARGDVRFVQGAGIDNVHRLYHRNGGDWALVNDEKRSGRSEAALGFSADGQLAYLLSEQPSGPDAIVSWNPATQERKVVLRDEVVDPARLIRSPGSTVPVGALFLGNTPHTRFFDESSDEARLYRSLEAAFPGRAVFITSSTRDGRRLLVETGSGSNPGEFYLYDRDRNQARFLMARSEWIDPETTASVRPVLLKARDGLELHGFLTVPHGSTGRDLPMVVVPHGGPIGIFDNGGFDHENQLLAAAGYAVLQINFRGSGNYGRAHSRAALKQWGRAMQDDVTDATRWAISEGIADARRICIYGASYGAYSAMMGAAREPGLYQCAAGYVGVYDLRLMFTGGDIQDRDSGMSYLREWLGDPATLGAVSPVNLAERIRVPVFLAAGGQDKRAPIQHTERMEAALKRAGTPVESLYYKTEGHGFYTQAHRSEYYGKLLAFLSRSLGGKTATTAAADGKGRAP
ncbi:TPA: alpha/beta hydrolase family protein [Stenotrophomonas maltophilia]|uniref:alpha/beta hydrolase family protein n=1 Tax=Stenotrophomonas maltophilia TaxID=40324 RepID=UPI000C16179C|nr:prolyl oligopeptidase family serine peptidase [Stenotrophomonas maltophilia]MBA0234236.1 S9 family peptidase [Stenotrophomonas maltophilia]MBA0268436.1 S9 family peptidase [Stenotrophomonas maltophilia]MBA0331457.1 S9 family peptidase [Stenotrophomonas maltophilia]MBN5120810.1 S9 family peptidase [Stenotrophomonas maltophilia]MBO3006002.1 S9 family peptidase [Stenotrophomonas maltophilia]